MPICSRKWAGNPGDLTLRISFRGVNLAGIREWSRTEVLQSNVDQLSDLATQFIDLRLELRHTLHLDIQFVIDVLDL